MTLFEGRHCDVILKLERMDLQAFQDEPNDSAALLELLDVWQC